jgi:predicted ATPase
MIESIEFTNYKALRNATLPLAPFTLLLGPNGSGKTTVLKAIAGIAGQVDTHRHNLLPNRVGPLNSKSWRPLPSAMATGLPIQIAFNLRCEDITGRLSFDWDKESRGLSVTSNLRSDDSNLYQKAKDDLLQRLASMRIYALDPDMIAKPVSVTADPLKCSGEGLPAVLDDIKDNYPERWNLLLAEFREWLPEYDHIQFVKPVPGQKAIALRTKRGGHQIPATELSQGTLVALALLTLAYLPNPPSLIGLEEIDRGLHPRLLRHLQDALYRLSYPESCGENRSPIQVIATTHSPYLLDLYRDHPEEVVLAQKEGLEVQFQRLSDIDHFHDILGNAPLSEVWYSGIFGGVAVKP